MFLTALLITACFFSSSGAPAKSTATPSGQIKNGTSVDKTENRTVATSLASSRSRTQDNQSKDLKKLIEDLEESDYSNIGSWGNFRSKKNIKPSESLSSSADNFSDDSMSLSADIQNLDETEEPYWQKQNQARIQAPAKALIELFDSPEHWRSLASDDSTLIPVSSLSFINFKSLIKITTLSAIVTLLSYLSVVPNNLPLNKHNAAFKSSLARVLGSLIGPMVLLIAVYRGKDADINKVIELFTSSFLVGYPTVLAVEALLATIARLIILKLIEPQIFSVLCPRVPPILVPWIFHQENYFPSRVTLQLFSFVSSLLVGPVVEEFFKLRSLRGALRTVSKTSSKTNATAAEDGRLSVRSYMIYMTAITLGLKAADNTRRILLYTSPNHRHKNFFAIARGFFPVQELCGAMTSLAIARRNVLGLPGMDFGSVAPAIALHLTANLRGMKSMFVWSSKRPWDELQLQMWTADDHAGPHQIIIAGVLNALWFMVLVRFFTEVMMRFSKLEFCMRMQRMHPNIQG